MRQLWVIRINAACRAQGLNYSRFMSALKALGVAMDRKALSELAIQDAPAFTALIEKAKGEVGLNES